MKHAEARRIRDLVREAVKNGEPLADVAARLGLSMAWARKHIGGPSGLPTSVAIPGVDTYKILAALIQTTDTYEQIGNRFGISKQRVGQIAIRAKEAGIALRTP